MKATRKEIVTLTPLECDFYIHTWILSFISNKSLLSFDVLSSLVLQCFLYYIIYNLRNLVNIPVPLFFIKWRFSYTYFLGSTLYEPRGFTFSSIVKSQNPRIIIEQNSNDNSRENLSTNSLSLLQNTHALSFWGFLYTIVVSLV